MNMAGLGDRHRTSGAVAIDGVTGPGIFASDEVAMDGMTGPGIFIAGIVQERALEDSARDWVSMDGAVARYGMIAVTAVVKTTDTKLTDLEARTKPP